MKQQKAQAPVHEHQAATVHVANRGMMKRLIWPYPRYINSVLFVPLEQGKPGDCS